MSVIAIDVDQTVVEVFTHWMDYIKTRYNIDMTGICESYRVGNEIDTKFKEMGVKVDPLAFWRRPHLYRDLEPITGVRETIQGLYDDGNTIIFVSSCFPEHQKSKEEFLKKNFPYHGFISTHSKAFVEYDFLIDDTQTVLMEALSHKNGNMNFKPKHILYTEKWDAVKPFFTEQCNKTIETINPFLLRVDDWKDVLKYIHFYQNHYGL